MNQSVTQIFDTFILLNLHRVHANAQFIGNFLPGETTNT